MRRRTLYLLASLVWFAGPLLAQLEHDHSGPPPARLGRVALPTSCGPAAQRPFERGVALLHSFWFEEAGRTFREVAVADPGCAMAWWGVSSSLLHPLWSPPTAIDIQQALDAVARTRAAGVPTAREQGYVDAIAAYWADAAATTHPQRLRRWSEALGRLREAHPSDREAATFYALSLIAVANSSPPDSTYARQREAAAILEPLFQRQPDHPGLAHYLIHAYDSPALARNGSRAAARYAGIAPSVPHARHMPSHIYIRLGMWDEAIASNTSSARAAREYEVQQQLGAVWDERLHAMDYLAYAYLQLGKDELARGVAVEADTITRYVLDHDIKPEYALAAIPARYALERERWSDAARLRVRPGLHPAAEAVSRFARAIGAARSGDFAAADAEVAVLRAIDDTLARCQVPLLPAMVHAQRRAAESWLALVTGDAALALRLATEAADLEDHSEKHPVTPGALLPARELLGDMLLGMGRPADALTAYRASLVTQPRRARSLAGAARAAELSGDRGGAQRYRRELRALLAKADRDRHEVSATR